MDGKLTKTVYLLGDSIAQGFGSKKVNFVGGFRICSEMAMKL